jgi:hypothetical protein
MTTKESLLYSVADTIQVPLVPFIGGYLGKAKQAVKVGPWMLHYEPTALSDVIQPDYATFFVHVNKDLWLYIEASDTGMLLHVVNGGLVGLNQSTLKTFGTGKLGETMKKLEKGIVSTYKFSESKQKWESLN